MAVWPAQLVKVRAGKRGSGWAVGRFGVLTARHVVERCLANPFDEERNPGGQRCLLVTGGPGAGTFDGQVVWEDQERDLALVAVVEGVGRQAWAERLVDHDPVVLADPGMEPVRASAIGFSDAMADQDAHTADPDQVEGALLPVAGPDELVSFDVDSSVPQDSIMWRGISGAAVRQTGDHQRLLGIVAQRVPDRSSRRLYASRLPDPAVDAGWAAALEVVGADSVVEDIEAPRARRYLLALDMAGRPWRVGQVPELGDFGVRKARDDVAPAEQPYFPYLDRPEAATLRDALRAALAGTGPRMVVLVGDSAAGKSRLAAEVVRGIPELADHRFIFPTAAERLRDVPRGFFTGRVVVWLDDLDKYLARDLDTHIVEQFMANPHAIIVGTLRADRLETLALEDYASAAHDLLGREDLLNRVPIDPRPDWSIPGTLDGGAGLEQEIAATAVASADAAGISFGEYLAAYQHLRRRYRNARAWAKSLIDTLADLARTGISSRMTRTEAWDVCLASAPESFQTAWDDATDEQRDRLLADAFTYGVTPVLGSTALINESRTGVTANELAQLERAGQPIPDPIWTHAAKAAGDNVDVQDTVALQAAAAGKTNVARALWTSLAERGESTAMFNLGALLKDTDLESARTWWEHAAAHDDPDAMYSLGVILRDTDPQGAQAWFEQATTHNHVEAMVNLGVLLQDDTEAARKWWERAAAKGHANAMNNLGVLARHSDPDAARTWFEQAAARGHADAMYSLGILIESNDLETARTWWERAAAHGHADAMVNLGVLTKDTDPDTARTWWERAAARGNAAAMNNLGVLLKDTEPDTARTWLEQAAAHGSEPGMAALGALYANSDPEAARAWWEKAAVKGHVGAMFALGDLLKETDPATAQDWWEQAATKGNVVAMHNVGVLLSHTDAEAARLWFEKAAVAGHLDAMAALGDLLRWTDPRAARTWLERAAVEGHVGAMVNLGVLVFPSDPNAARTLWEQAAARGSVNAMNALAHLLQDREPAAAHAWLRRAAQARSPR